jgi:hypothetical protein
VLLGRGSIRPEGVFTKLKGAVMERLLEAEISEHVGHEKQGRRRSSNSRNGHSPKVGQTETGPIEIQGRPLGGLRSSGPSCGSVRRPQLDVRRGPSPGRRFEPSRMQLDGQRGSSSGRDGSHPSPQSGYPERGPRT